MRLLNTTTLKLEQFLNNMPQYAILSHTWGEQEVTFNDISSSARTSLKGRQKVKNCCKLARSQGWQYVWIDTCCINKADSYEFGEAINSMFRWYEEAQICYAFLEDVPPHYCSDGKSRPRNSEVVQSRWFTRGWTQQELLAPSFLAFVDSDWNIVGSRETCTLAVAYATTIEQKDIQNFRSCSIATELSWASKRQTTKIEDRAYSMMGLLGVHMPLLYGEGKNAFVRLQHELIRLFNDETVLLWTTRKGSVFSTNARSFAERMGGRGRYPEWMVRESLFAESPEAFSESNGLAVIHFDKGPRNVGLSNGGISLKVELFQRFEDEGSKYQQRLSNSRTPALYAIKLNCARTSEPDDPMILPLAATGIGHPVYEVLRTGSLYSWQEFMDTTRLLRGKRQSLGRHSITLTHPKPSALINPSTTLLTVPAKSSRLASLLLRKSFGYRPDKDSHQQWSFVAPRAISSSSDAGLLGFADMNYFGTIMLKDGGALMTNGTLYIQILGVTGTSSSPIFYLLVVYFCPPFPRFGIWLVDRKLPRPERWVDILNQSNGPKPGSSIDGDAPGPEHLLKFLNKDIHTGFDLDSEVDYPHTAPFRDNLLVQVTTKPTPLSPNSPPRLEGHPFSDDPAQDTAANCWLRRAAADELTISKHVQLEISLVEKELLENDHPDEVEWKYMEEMEDDDDLCDLDD